MLQLSEQEYNIPPFHELRIITSTNPAQRVRVTLQPNSEVEEITADEMMMISHNSNNNMNIIPHAEIYGSELTPGIPVQLPLCRSISVFTITGATVRVKRLQEEQSKQKKHQQTKKEIVHNNDSKNSSNNKRIKTELESNKNTEEEHPQEEEEQENCNSNEAKINKTVSENKDFSTNKNHDEEEKEEDNIVCGPRVLIVSDEPHVGCSTYVKWLAQLALRERKPDNTKKLQRHLALIHPSSAAVAESYYHTLVLESNPCNPSLGYPCCLSLYELQHTLDVEEEATFVPALHACIGTSTSSSSYGSNNNNEYNEIYAGSGDNNEPHEHEANMSLHLHAFRSLMQAAIEKMARCAKCRRGGMFIDYGVIDPHQVLLAEEAEIKANEEEQNRQDLMKEEGAEMLNERVKSRNESISINKPRRERLENTPMNPLDILLDVMEEAEVDHVMVVQSA